MNRRRAIKSFILASGAILIMPSCIRQEGKASIVLNNLNVSAEQEELLAEIVDTLIPPTDSPGAKELQLHLFVLKMVDDCHEESDQQDFMNGLSAINGSARQYLGEPFVSSTQQKRESFLKVLELNEDVSKELKSFYNIMKRRTIQGYLNSEYVMTNLVKYELVPGRYNGYMPA